MKGIIHTNCDSAAHHALVGQSCAPSDLAVIGILHVLNY